MATTREKLNAMFDEIERMPPDAASSEARDLVEGLQIAQGLGLDLRAMLMPTSDAAADVLIDQLIALLYALRGDDLAPFDLERVTVESGDGD